LNIENLQGHRKSFVKGAEGKQVPASTGARAELRETVVQVPGGKGWPKREGLGVKKRKKGPKRNGGKGRKDF